MKKNYTFTLLFTLLFTSFTFSQIVINEIDADQDGTDNAEFIELLWTPNTSLDGYVVVLFNGSDDKSYASYDLDGFTTDANGFFILASSEIYNASTDIALSTLQNGADAVAVYQEDASSFPNDTEITTDDLIDIVIYDTGQSDDSGLLSGFGETIQYNENINSAKTTESIQRKDDGTYEVKSPTFRTANFATAAANKYVIKGFKLYPNPVVGETITIATTSITPKKVTVFNLLGKKVYSKIVLGNRNSIDLTTIQKGIYIIRIIEGKKVVTQKLVIQK